MPVKDNHLTLRKKIDCFFASPNLFQAEFVRAEQTEISRGRIETRRILLSDNVPEGFTGFAGVRQLFCLERERTIKKTGLTHKERVLGMTSLSRQEAGPEKLLELMRGHWSIENKSHYVRDVTFREDRSQVRNGNLPQVLAAIRNTCISVMRIHGHTNIAAACRRFAARPNEALELIGCKRK